MILQQPGETFFDEKDFRKNENGELILTDLGYRNMLQLCHIVCNKHFSYVQADLKEDLIQIGLLKILELLNKSHFDSKKASLKTFLYTGVRNEMTNFLFKQKRVYCVEETSLALQMDTRPCYCTDTTRVTAISFDTIKTLFRKLYLTKEQAKRCLSTLLYLGFQVEGYEDDNPTYYPYMEMLISTVIWSHTSSIRRECI